MVSTLRSGGLYQRKEPGFGPLVGAPEILNGRSSVIATDADDPLNYVFAFFGDDFNVYDDRNFVARRMDDIPDKDIMAVIINCFGEAIEARGPLAHRITGNFDGIEITYDRIIFPTVNKAGRVDRLVTLSGAFIHMVISRIRSARLLCRTQKSIRSPMSARHRVAPKSM